MDEYISREEVLETIRYRVCQGQGNKEHMCKRGSCAYCGIMEIMSDISSIEVADVRTIKQGRWIVSNTQKHIEVTYECSECQHEVVGEYEKTPFCGGCGVRMAVTANENTNPKGKIDIDRLLTDMDGDSE